MVQLEIRMRFVPAIASYVRGHLHVDLLRLVRFRAESRTVDVLEVREFSPLRKSDSIRRIGIARTLDDRLPPKPVIYIGLREPKRKLAARRHKSRQKNLVRIRDVEHIIFRGRPRPHED